MMWNIALFVILGIIFDAVSDLIFARSLSGLLYAFLVFITYWIDRTVHVRAYRKSFGRKRIDAYLRCSSLTCYLVFLIMRTNGLDTIRQKSFRMADLFSFVLIVVLIIYYFICLEMKKRLYDASDLFEKNLTAQSRIVILSVGKNSMRLNRFLHKFFEIFGVFRFWNTGNGYTSLTIIYKEYLYIPKIVAEVFWDQLKENKKYLVLAHPLPKRKELNGFTISQDCEKIFLFNSSEDKYGKDMELLCQLYLPEKICKMNFFEYDFGATAPTFHGLEEMHNAMRKDPHPVYKIAAWIDAVHSPKPYLQELFQTLAAGSWQHPGKSYLCSMINAMLAQQEKVAEYFYDLVKMAEFIVHYKSFADYDRLHCDYLDGDINLAMGTFTSNASYSAHSELLKNEAYIQALKYLSYVNTGKEIKVSSENPLGDGIERVVNLRNRFIGHGTMTYSVSEELVRQLAVIVWAMAMDFMDQDDSKMNISLLDGKYNKCIMQEGNLYLLLSANKDRDFFFYLDYRTGRVFSTGSRLKIEVGRKKVKQGNV